MLSNSSELIMALLYSTMLTTLQLASFLGIFFILGFIIAEMEKKRNHWIQGSVGRKGIYLTAWIGVPIHEIGHALVCLLFGHKVEEIKFVQFGDADGTMGYVNHSYEPSNLFHRIGLFFIGIAPMVMGVASITLALWLTLPDTFEKWWTAITTAETLLDSLVGTVSLIPALFTIENLSNGWFYAFLVFSISVASHMTLSQADIQGAKSGLITLYVVLIVVNLFQVNSMERLDVQALFLNGYNLFVYSVSFIAILFAGFATGIGYLLHRLRKPSV